MIRLITTTDADTTAATTVILTADDLESIATHRQTLQLYSRHWRQASYCCCYHDNGPEEIELTQFTDATLRTGNIMQMRNHPLPRSLLAAQPLVHDVCNCRAMF